MSERIFVPDPEGGVVDGAGRRLREVEAREAGRLYRDVTVPGVPNAVVRVDADDQAATEARWADNDAVAAGAEAYAASKAYRRARQAAYAADLAEEDPAYVSGAALQLVAMGDTLDTLIGQVEAMRREAGLTATADWDAMLTKIAAVKAAHPKP